jgi:hypothetical protein
MATEKLTESNTWGMYDRTSPQNATILSRFMPQQGKTLYKYH